MTKTNRSLRSLLTGLLVGVVIGAGLALPMSTGADPNPAACDRIGPSVVWINRGSQSISYDLALTHAPKAFWPAGLDPRDPDTPTSTNIAESGELGVSGLPVGLIKFGTLLDSGDTCVWRTFEVFLNDNGSARVRKPGTTPPPTTTLPECEMPEPAPITPTTFTAGRQGDDVTLTWAPDGDDPHAWNVYKRGARVHWENLPDRGLVATLDGSARDWTDTEASDEWTVYHVKAVNADGTESHPAKSKVKKVKR